MIKYLDYIINELPQLVDENAADELIAEINYYKECWQKYSSDISRNPMYKSKPRLYDKHDFVLPTEEHVSISWDVDQLYNIAKQAPIYQASLFEFENLIKSDLIGSEDEFLKIAQKVNSVRSHEYAPILVLFFKPTQDSIIIDGRHRYMEYKKFKTSEKIPFYYLDDEMCFSNILNKNELLTYIILHNIKIIYDWIVGCGTLERILNIESCMGC